MFAFEQHMYGLSSLLSKTQVRGEGHYRRGHFPYSEFVHLASGAVLRLKAWHGLFIGSMHHLDHLQFRFISRCCEVKQDCIN